MRNHQLRNLKNIVFRAVYKPDMEKMVNALRILHEYNPSSDKPTTEETNSIKEKLTG
ncbi:hypothetical protein L1765_10190 [Microaerobacter geothermalis]|uniref:hypothetical protein n=1 Tax=Microaerobacter geothermalis TaxID=674972 RepID=UPI001F2BB42A|nr:hypothetical protein [Microaerobacter geothermalis]MCF6094332.1 hypothetical protein [Microaerobacter geothermalis]